MDYFKKRTQKKPNKKKNITKRTIENHLNEFDKTIVFYWTNEFSFAERTICWTKFLKNHGFSTG